MNVAHSLILLCLFALSLAVAQPALANPLQPGFPNIIVILADDLGFGDLSIYNPQSKIHTPNLDTLARQGMLFTDAHSGAGICSPSRYGLLTGQHFSRRPWNSIKKQLAETMIASDRLTLGELLQARGYHTGAFGKWHLGQTFFNHEGETAFPGKSVDWSAPSVGGPNDHGFDVFYGVAFGHNHMLHAFMRDRLVTQTPSVFTPDYPAKAEDFSPELVMPAITREFLQYIDWNATERAGKPFFAYFAPVSVHAPLTPSQEFVGSTEAGLYGDFVVQIDASVGAMMARLRAHGLADNTLVLFSSDNGSHGRTQDSPTGRLFPPGSLEDRYGHSANGPWRGYKGSIYEGAHRVPFIAHWPGKIASGSTASQLIALEDIMATVANIVGVELNEGTAEDSYNILPYLDGSHRGGPVRRYALSNTRHGSPVLRKDDWVYAFHLQECDLAAGREGSIVDALALSGCGSSQLLWPGLYRHGHGSNLVNQRVFREHTGYPVIRRAQWVLSYLPTWNDDCRQCGQLYELGDDPGQQYNRWHERSSLVEELIAFHEADRERGHSLGIDR